MVAAHAAQPTRSTRLAVPDFNMMADGLRDWLDPDRA
jgi:hypothetical protein